jgi:hypothetical protein
MTKVILGREAAKPIHAVSAGGLAASIVPPLFAFGLVLFGVGLVDLGLVWIPFRFGVGEWEFGTASRTFDSLALGTTGFVFLAVAASARGWDVVLRLLAAAAVVIMVALLGAFILYALNAPLALRAIDDSARTLLLRAMFRTTAFAGMYILLFGWLSWFTWRQAGAAMRGATS